MRTYIKPFVLILFFSAAQFSFATATNNEVLAKAIKAYEKAIKVSNKLNGKDKGSKNENANKNKKITREQYTKLKKVLDNASELFDQYLRVSNDANKKKVARFYLLIIKKIDFASTNKLGRYRANYKKIRALNNELNIIKGYYFPLRYKNNGKSYIIKYTVRKNLERQLLVKFTEASAFSYKKTAAAKWAKKVYAFYNYGDYNLWWSAHMWYHNYEGLHKVDAELVESAEKLIYSMSGLKRKDIKTILDSNYANYTHAYSKLNSVLRQKPELSRDGEVWVKAAESFEKLDKDNWAMEYYKKALDGGYGNKTFLLKMMRKGKNKSNKELVKTAAEIFDNKNLYAVSYSCTEYETIANYFEYIGNESKAQELKDKYKKCDKALTKQQRRANRGRKFYVSFAPFAPISKNLQGSIQIGGRKRLHELGIKQTNSQGVIGADDKEFKWGGLSYYYTYKKFISKEIYRGFQIRYTNRKYENLTATIRNKTTNASFTQTFTPTEPRYDFTFNMGALITSRLFHIEFYSAIGLGYFVFDGGRTEWDNSNFEITNRDVLNERGNNSVGLTIRMGIQLGLNFANR